MADYRLEVNNQSFLILIGLITLSLILFSRYDVLFLLFSAFSLGYLISGEKSLLNFGYGLSLIVILGVIFNLLKIPIHWSIFLFLGIIATFIGKKLFNSYFFEIGEKISLDRHYSLFILLTLVIFNLFVYYDGATRYFYYENGDPWGHALGVYLIKETYSYSTFFHELPLKMFERWYVEPYPPGFDIVLGLLSQINNSVKFSLKFFNSFLVAYALIPVFYLFRLLSKDDKFALIGTIIILLLPAFMSHFIWAQTLAMTFFIMGLHSLAQLFETTNVNRNKYMRMSILSISALGLTQPSVAATFVAVSVLLLIAKIRQSGIHILKDYLLVGFSSLILVLLIYLIPTYMKFGLEKTILGIGLFDYDQTKPDIIKMFTDKTLDTSGGYVYSLEDFFIAKEFGKIDQQIGIGFIASILLIIGFFLLVFITFNDKNYAYAFIALFFIFSILGVQGNALPIKLFPHRFWVFLAIPSAFIITYTIFYFLHLINNRYIKVIIGIILLLLIIYSSGYPKYIVQTSNWPPHVFSSIYEIDGYEKMVNFTTNGSRVLPLCNSPAIIVGYDRKIDIASKELYLFRNNIRNKNLSISEIEDYIKNNNYQYFTIDTSCARYYSEQEINNMIQYFQTKNNQYLIIYNNPGFFLFKRLN